MTSDDRPTDDLKPKRRGKAPTITLEAREIEQTPASAASEEGLSGASPEAETVADPAATETLASTDAGATADPVAPEDMPTAPPIEPAPSVDVSPAVPPDTTVAGERPEDPPAEAASVVTPVTDSTPIESTSAAAEPPPVPPEPPAREEPVPVPPAASGGGFGRLAAAGLVGALIAGGGTVAAQLAGYWPATGRADTTALEQRLAALDGQMRQIAARPQPAAAPAVDLAPLTRRIEALDAARATLEGRLAAVERRATTPAASAPATASQAAPPAPAVDLAPLKTEIDALKVAVEAIAAAQRTAAQTPTTQPPAPAVDTAAVDARITALVAPQTARIDAATSRVRAIDEEIKAQAAAAQALAARITALEGARAQAGEAGKRAALVVGLSSLRGAVERGQPFAAELKAVAALGLPADAARTLEAHAERGVPTGPALAQRFSALAPALLRAAPARASDGTLIDRLTATAQNLVRVRPVGEAAGDDVPTVVSRMEARLRRGDVAGALADLERLPEPVRALAASWAAEARARVAAEATLRRLTLDATAALTGG